MPDDKSSTIIVISLLTALAIIQSVIIRQRNHRILDLEHDLKWSRERADYLESRTKTSAPTKPQPDCAQLNQALNQNMTALNQANAKAAHAEQRYEQMLRFWHTGYAGMVLTTREGDAILTRFSLN